MRRSFIVEGPVENACYRLVIDTVARPFAVSKRFWPRLQRRRIGGAGLQQARPPATIVQPRPGRN